MAAVEHAGARRCVQCRRVLADVRNVALLVQGRVDTETRLCRACLTDVRDSLRPRMPELAASGVTHVTVQTTMPTS